MLKLIYITVFCLALVCPAEAQDQEKKYVYRDTSLLQNGDAGEEIVEELPAPDEGIPPLAFKEEVLDTTLYPNNLYIPADSVQYWKDMKAFAYVEHMDSLLKQMQEKQQKNVRRDTGPSLFERFLASQLTQILLWSLAVFFVLFIIYRLFLAEGVFRRETRSSKQVSPAVEEEVITNESDFNALISQALRNSNYRQAVRYHYLKTLHNLAAKELIELSPDKTNYQYVREIKKPLLQNEFASLTLNYEYVWYGEFAIEENTYRKIENYFSAFDQKL
jgi:Domain of unknown function (DUF4129)